MLPASLRRVLGSEQHLGCYWGGGRRERLLRSQGSGLSCPLWYISPYLLVFPIDLIWRKDSDTNNICELFSLSAAGDTGAQKGEVTFLNHQWVSGTATAGSPAANFYIAHCSLPPLTPRSICKDSLLVYSFCKHWALTRQWEGNQMLKSVVWATWFRTLTLSLIDCTILVQLVNLSIHLFPHSLVPLPLNRYPDKPLIQP